MNKSVSYSASATASATATFSSSATASANATSSISVDDAANIAQQKAYYTALNLAQTTCNCESKCSCNTNNACSVLLNNDYGVENTFPYFIANLLTSIGVNSWVGIPGSNQLYLYYALYQLKINTYLIRNEANGGYIALGSSKMSSLPNNKRQLTAIFTDQGPGFAQIMNQMCCASLEGCPLLNFSIYDVDTSKHNRVPQDINPIDVVGGVSKAYYLMTADDIADKSVVNKLYDAIQKGFSYPAGAINIIFGPNTIKADATTLNANIGAYKQLFKNMFLSDYGLRLKTEIMSPQPFTGLYDASWNNTRNTFIQNNQANIIDPSNYQTFFESILKPSQRPLFVIGNGCLDIVFDVMNFCKKIKCPYLFTLPMASYSNKEDPYSAIRMGHTATYCGNNIAYDADLIILVGISFNTYTLLELGNPFQSTAIRVSINPYPELYDTTILINKYVIDVIQNVIQSLDTNLLQPNTSRDNWFHYIKDLKIEGDLKNSIFYNPDPNKPLLVGDIFDVIQKNVDDYLNRYHNKVYLVTDTGSGQPFTASLFTCKNINYNIVSFTKFASIGSGLGMVIGMAHYYPNDIFILLAGDACSLWSINDIITIKEMNLKNIIIIVSENYGLGLIEEESKESNDRNLEFGNGYKYYPRWKDLFCGMLLKTEIAKNKTQFTASFENAMSNLFKESSCIVTFVPYNLYFSPLCKLGGSFIDQDYLIPDANNPIDDCRFSK